MDFIKKIPLPVIMAAIAVVLIVVFMMFRPSKFKTTLITPPDQIDDSQPGSFPPLDEPKNEEISLEKPVVPEEIGLAMVYPQGQGVGMSKGDSDSFGSPNVLLTSYTTPESYGVSSIVDPAAATESSRIIKIRDTGNQMAFKPVDESMKSTFAGAYNQSDVQDGKSTLINGTTNVNYNELAFDPEQNLKLQASPGQQSNLPNCESTYPNVVKYDGMCITQGDIPYGQQVDGKVNPRLVSRWESYTGNYSRQDALQAVDGLLYPNLNVQM